MNRLRALALLGITVILVIAGFQGYWLRDNYNRENATLQSRTEGLFGETVRVMRDSILQEKIFVLLRDTANGGGKGRSRVLSDSAISNKKSISRFVNVLSQTVRDDSYGHRRPRMIMRVNDIDDAGSLQPSLPDRKKFPEEINGVLVVKGDNIDTAAKRKGAMPGGRVNTIYLRNDNGHNTMVRLDSLMQDSIPIPQLEKTFAGVLKKEKLSVPFTVIPQAADLVTRRDEFSIAGFKRSTGYKLQLGNTCRYLLKRISWPIIFSIFLVGLAILSFALLYKSLVRQYRLAQMKNDLISNITHELKTPIATVGVAIEALQNFNAINDPARTREYLDISQSELQRLGLLVDKVLKLSMFENKKIVVQREQVNLDELVKDVVASLRLQAERLNARVSLRTEGETTLEADRMHLLSVIFNLLDNAIKYSRENPAIQVTTSGNDTSVILTVTDNGLGIEPAYHKKIFEKFFRVPTGDTHNAKGHGLGLSYVAQVVRQHNGSIAVSSQEGIGSTFTITLPKRS